MPVETMTIEAPAVTPAEGTNTAPPPAETPPAEPAQQPSTERVAERLAMLRRKEVLARRAELEAKGKVEGMESKLRDAEAKAQRLDRVAQLLNDNPLVALEEMGISEGDRKKIYEAMTRELVDGRPAYEAHKRVAIDGKLKSLEDKVQELTKALEDERTQTTQRRQVAIESEALGDVSTYLKGDESSYELTLSHGSDGVRTVLETAKILAKKNKHKFNGDADAFSKLIIKDAAAMVESHFETEAIRLASLKKVQAKLGIKDTKANAEIKTLTNALSGSPVLPGKSENTDDVIDAAVRAFRMARK